MPPQLVVVAVWTSHFCVTMWYMGTDIIVGLYPVINFIEGFVVILNLHHMVRSLLSVYTR